jgi:shikimate dehydrogenase
MPRGSTHVAGVIGDPVRHSLSPVLHNAAFAALDLDWVYVAFEVAAGQGADAVAAMVTLGIDGLSVTMPHKADVAAAVDECTAGAARLDAVNCVARRGDHTIGHNTDGAGFIDALRLDEGFDPNGRRAVVLGAGGAARAVVLALAEAGASQVGVVNRSRDRGEAAAGLAGSVGRVVDAAAIDDADLVVNATPIGMAGVVAMRPGTEADALSLPLDPRRLGAGQLVVDLIYEPVTTPLLLAARGAGAAVANGLGMLIHQAAHAFRIWTGEDPPTEAMSAAAVAELARRAAP